MINIGNNWFVDSDEYSFCVKRKAYVKEGKTKGAIRWENQTWHSNWDQLKRKIAELQLKEVIENEEFNNVFSLLDNFTLQEKEIKAL